VPRFALIQDGTETTRQRFADVLGCFKRCASDLSDQRFSQFSFEVFTDERVGALLETVDPDEWACLVFASNALLSGEVENAVTAQAEPLHEYLAAGGGLVVLHQQRDDLAPLLPDDMLPELRERTSARGATSTEPAAGAQADVVLRYPDAVDWTCLRDIRPDEVAALRDAGHALELPSFFFKVIEGTSLPAALRPVLVSSAGEVLVCRSQDYVAGRVVVATPPLDFQSARPGPGDATRQLLANAIRYAALGRPRRLVWYRGERTDNEMLLRWLNRDGAAALHTAPSTPAGIDATDAWLLGVVDAFVLPAARLKEVEPLDETQEFLARGGALIATAREPGERAIRATAVIGRYAERALASELFTELRAVEEWRTAAHAFELRNIVSALALLAQDPVHRANAAAIDPASLDDLKASVQERLLDPNHREDLGSSIALAQCLAHLEPPDSPVDERYIGWLQDEAALRPFDVALQIRAVLASCRRQADGEFLQAAHAGIESAEPSADSLAPLVRALDAIALLDQSALLPDDPDSVAAIAALAARRLRGSPRLPSGGWLSVEATADATLGLVALYRRLPADAGDLEALIVDHAASAASALRSARRRYRPSGKGVAWLARLDHALVVADREFPIGLERLGTLELTDARDAHAGGRAGQALLEDLALRNETLRLRENAATTSLEQTRAEFAGTQLAARIGRATATLVPTLLLAAAFVVVVLEIGWSSIGGVLANIGVLLGVVLTLLGWIFALLDRLGLLAGPASRVRATLEAQGVPLVGQLSKLKRG
jgi:hypothetical protein